MNDRQMKYMLTILREGSISKAAELLYVSQPSLSQMVRKVEEELGAELFVRHTTPMVLTPEGECYMQAARSIRSIQENLNRKLDEIRSGSRGEILLGIPVQRALEVVPRIFPWMREHYPEVRIRLTETGSDSLESLLLNHRLDMACLTTSAKANPLNYILIAREQIMLLAGKHTAIARRIPGGTEIDIAEARAERFIRLKPGHSTRITEDRLFVDRHMSPDVLFETESIEVAKRSVAPCQAVFLCPKNYLDISPELYRDCVSYPVSGIDRERHFYICHRRDRYLPQYMTALIRLLQPEYQPGEDVAL